MRSGWLVVLGLCLAASNARSAAADIDATAVQESIDRGVDFLKRSQRADGSWPAYTNNPGGVTALCTLALLNAGVPTEDEAIQKAFNHLRAIEPATTYSSSLIVMAFCAAKSRRDVPVIQQHVRWLERTQLRPQPGIGMWGYTGGGNGDSSNSQFALLALHEADRFGVTVNERTWSGALKYWQTLQSPNGSFGYTLRARAGFGSMTCAGISSIVIASSRLNEGDARINGNQVDCCAKQEPDPAIERGLQWLGREFSVNHNPQHQGGWLYYYLYGLERVGRLTAHRFVGGHDWYREGVDFLIHQQDQLAGFWKGAIVEADPNIATSFALLFLSKGRRPVLLSKVRHGPGDDWDNHSHDVANLISYVETQWERDLTWQIVDPQQAGPADLLQSPVLFINGRAAPEFTDQEVTNLRTYVDQGGFIFAEACCEGDEFDAGFRKLCERMFPEPEYRLQLLPPNHAVWHAEKRVDPELQQPLEGIDVGCRTSVIYCPEDLSCYWELGGVGRTRTLPADVAVRVAAANAIGINVLAYATNRELKYKDQIRDLEPEVPEDSIERAKLYIAKIRHTGGWDEAPRALTNLERALQRELKLRVSTEPRELNLVDDELFDYHLVFMHGRHEFRFTAAEREQLRRYIENGGTLFGDAICASEQFTAAFRREMTAIFPDQPLKEIPINNPMFTPKYGGFDLQVVRRREPRRGAANDPLAADVREVPPELYGIEIDGRYGVIFSPYDLSCALEKSESLQCPGYIREDAARIGINVVLYTLH